MSCNCNCNCNCNKANTVIVLPKKKPVKAPIHQLKEDGEAIYPVTLTSAVHNPKTGENLDIMLSKHNHLYLVYQGNFADTVEEIPEEYRHEGLVITYTNCSGKVKHKVYKGVSKNNCSFTDKANWEDFIKTEESNYTDKAPSNLRYEGNTLKLDVVNKEGLVIETLSAVKQEDTQEDKWYKNTSLSLNGNTIELIQTSNTGKECKQTLDLTPLIAKRVGFKAQVSPTVPTVSNAEAGVIYVVPNPSVPGTAREYILVESPLGRYIEQLGSASGMCSILNEKLDNGNADTAKDNRLLRGELQGNSIVLTVGNNTTEQEITIDLSSIIPKAPEPVDLTSITDRLEVLENKQDNDTIYNDTPIKEEINTLKEKVRTLENKEDSDTIFDPTSINDRLSALEAKPDKDTLYNDSEVKAEINTLKDKVQTLENRPVGDSNTAYDDREIKERITALETKQDKDTVYDDTELSNRVQALEGKTDADTYPTNLEVLDTETPTTKKIKLTLNNSKSPLEANINIPQSSGTTNSGAVVFISQSDYDTKLGEGSLDSNKLYVITN